MALMFCFGLALSLAFDVPDLSTSFVEAMSMSQQPVPKYTQSPVAYQPQQQQERHPILEPINFNYTSLSMYSSGPPRYDHASPGGTFDTRSVSSSPGPITPMDVKPPAYVEPSKINPYDFSSSMFGSEHPTPQYAPPLYSYMPEQQGLLYLNM